MKVTKAFELKNNFQQNCLSVTVTLEKFFLIHITEAWFLGSILINFLIHMLSFPKLFHRISNLYSFC
jgi:hypothetical protein